MRPSSAASCWRCYCLLGCKRRRVTLRGMWAATQSKRLPTASTPRQHRLHTGCIASIRMQPRAWAMPRPGSVKEEVCKTGRRSPSAGMLTPPRPTTRGSKRCGSRTGTQRFRLSNSCRLTQTWASMWLAPLLAPGLQMASLRMQRVRPIECTCVQCSEGDMMRSVAGLHWAPALSPAATAQAS